MHLYFMTRGIKQQRNLFVMFMQTQMFRWTRKNSKTKKDEVCSVQGALRPIELWEYVFPEECLPEVLTMLDVDEDGTPQEYKGWKNNQIIKMIRKCLGAERVPAYKKVPTNKFVEHRSVAITPIGIRKDRHDEFLGYNQEML